MGLEFNKQVERLNAFQPFNANSARLYQENVLDYSPRDTFQTNAHLAVERLLESDSARVVILTGDAGHGKTHLCVRIISEFESDPTRLLQILNTRCNGDHVVAKLSSGRDLRIIKDLSEFDVAGDKVAKATSDPDSLTIICANEGKLRKTVQERNDLRGIREVLNEGAAAGRTTLGDGIYILNMNYQSVAAQSSGRPSIVDQVLRSWAADARNWKTCDRCDAKPVCPIFENHRLLSDPDRAGRRREAFETLVKVVEESGHVVTIRELLIVAAHAITGGLRCEDVHRRYSMSANEASWQAAYIFHETVFGHNLTAKQAEQVRLLQAFRQLDPGKIALRAVDDFMESYSSDAVGRFLPIDTGATRETPRSRSQARRDSNRQRRGFEYLRRRSYFNIGMDEAESFDFSERLGFRHARSFFAISDGTITEQELVDVRDQLLSGMEAIQGVRRSTRGSFVVVDPAFTTRRSKASVVAAQLPSSTADLYGQSDWWRKTSLEEPQLVRDLDWIDRQVFLVFGDADRSVVAIGLDLYRFEIVMRYADGLQAAQHFAGPLRMLNAQLASLVDQSSSDAGITLYVDGERHKLMIDRGNRIKAVEA